MSRHPKIQCQCGTVCLEAPQAKPIEVYICHCTECRRQSASAFGISAIFPREGMLPFAEHLQSQIAMWSRPTEAGNTLQCYFCKTCGVRILHGGVLKDGTVKPTVSVKGGCIEGLSLEGVKHIWTKSAVVPVPDDGEPGEPS